jgi:aryl-alcohol dehydrogenase-like predicted oxidoreductase
LARERVGLDINRRDDPVTGSNMDALAHKQVMARIHDWNLRFQDWLVAAEEDVASVMGELIAEGKILGWGQSQATEEQIRRAHAVTPLTAIQSEYSIMERMFEKDVIPACEELGIGFVPFSPLASGFLSGKVTANATYTGDVRRVITRFDKDNIHANQPLLEPFELCHS